jgi:formylglycine-generating enzyme required for sulfatase activity
MKYLLPQNGLIFHLKEKAERYRLELESKKNAEKERLAEEQRKKSEPAKTYTNSLDMEFILIPAGEFMMGAVPQDKEASDSEKPQHKVRITKPFYMGKYLVTQEEWEKIMVNDPSKFKEAGKKAPVETVSWDDCQEFIKKLNQKEGKTYRLPTEAEWEYSARGGDSGGSTIYTYGNDASKLRDYAWYDGNSGNTKHPVGQKKPNSLGLYDIMGNVFEWCGDWYDDEYYKNCPSADPKGADGGVYRVLRGGSWSENAEDSRLSFRSDQYSVYMDEVVGFRLVLLP